MRVLLVEDEPGYARFLRGVLLESGGDMHDPATVGSASEAIAVLERATFDIILLDLGLPDTDGTEALTQVLAAAPATPIVVLSSHDDLDVALASMRLGAQEYLLKGQSEHVLLPRALRYAIERKRLQDAARMARAEAERANAVKDEFLAKLGHELRNPLAPIVTGLALIERASVPIIAGHVEVLKRQVHYLTRLVDDLLDVARIAHGKMELEPATIPIADVIAASVEIAKPLADRKGHAVVVEGAIGADLVVRGDRARLTQVFANILTNAAKYTDGDGLIRIAARRVAGFVEVRVHDNGIGMTPELVALAFELFKQGERTPDRSGGLGLGLAVARSIVTLHGGTISASSEGPGRGCEMVVRLPLDRTTTAVVGAEEREHATEPPASSMPLRILVVDDNEDAAELLEEALERHGYIVDVALTGNAALALAERSRPDLALVDIGLPDIDGYSVARTLRARLGEATPHLVALTGYGQPSDLARSTDAGFDQHLVKPVALARLEVLAADLSRRRA